MVTTGPLILLMLALVSSLVVWTLMTAVPPGARQAVVVPSAQVSAVEPAGVAMPLRTMTLSTVLLGSLLFVLEATLAATARPSQPVTITGSLTYLQRLALPPDSHALLELRDAASPESAPVIAERRVELRGRQVPLPFELTVDRAKLPGGKKYIVRGTIVTDGRPAWVSADVADDLLSPATDLGSIRLTPYQAKPVPAEMMCGTERVTVSVEKGAARVAVGGHTFVMRQVPAASGAKYEVEGEASTSYWSRGNNGTLVIKGQTSPECIPAAAAKPPGFRAAGNEPGWTLQISDNVLTLVTDYGAKTTIIRSPAMTSVPGGRRYTGTAEGRSATATVLHRICRDTMTGVPRPNTVEVSVDGKILNGCGGEPGALLQGGTWLVQSVSGSQVVANSRVTVTFGADGMVSGNSSCNSYRGPYTISGKGLTIGQTAGTLKACLPELMTQEAAFSGVLRDVRHFDIRSDGTLELKTGDGRTIVATKGK